MRRTFVSAAVIAASVVFGLSSVSAAHAQAKPAAAAEHAHSSPHGGEVTGFGAHHVEFKADSTGAIHVWLLDGKEQTVAPPSGATVTLMGRAGSQVTLPLEVDQTSKHLIAKFDAAKFPTFQAVVSMMIEGKRQNLRFRYPASH